VSIVHAYEAGDASRLPAPSFARTWNVCDPSPRLEYVAGLLHAPKATPSRLHSKSTEAVTASPPVNENAAEALFDGFAGVEVSDVVGAVVSCTVTLKLPFAVLFAASVAEQFTVVAPSANVLPEAGVQFTVGFAGLASSAVAV